MLDVDGDAAAAVAQEIGGESFLVDVGDPDTAPGGGRGRVEWGSSYNNAGVGSFNWLEWDPVEWDRIIRVNLTGVLPASALPHLLAGGGGIDRQYGVVSGTWPAGEGPYAASKAAVALPPGVLEYALHPGERCRRVRSAPP